MLKAPETIQSLQTAFVMINCESDHEADVIDQVRSIKGIKEAVRINGPHDILCSIEAPTVESLREIIEYKIRKTCHVKTTTTLIRSY